MRYSLLLLVLIGLSCQPKQDTPQIIELDSAWQFKNISDSKWTPAIVPGNVHSDLLENKLIENPFIQNNEHNLQWISETDWEYRTTFLVNKQTLEKENLELNFEGLDTYSSIYLNDSLILTTNNAFREFQVDVKPLLKAQNELRILFENTTKYEVKAKAKLNYPLPEGNRIFTRKAQFQYGWDWGPKLNTVGIWKPVSLKAWNEVRIKDVYIEQLELNNALAELKIDVKLSTSNIKNLTYEIYVNNELNKAIPQANELMFNISNPKRWWPHNLGNPYLYDITVVLKKDNIILDSSSIKTGLRTIELITEKDTIGESFFFKVNDIPVYAKGANYIPQNSMQNEVTAAHYEKLIDDAVEANMNMLRIWGGGIYENDIFYDLCDEKGVLVWQDFMFACAMYPGDEDYLKNVQQEAIDNVKRLRNHTSIALWCGNNENSEGWHRWGWQDGRSKAEKDEIWSNYLKLFDSILPNTVANLTNTAYWESSPKYGRGNPKYETEGDAHDWWIWHDAYPFEHLEIKVPRFMSEFGFQSFPSYEVIKYINKNDSLEITSDGFKNHQKHSRGFQLIDEYMARDFPVPSNAEDYIYMSQLLQSYGITKGIEAQRRSKPYNMGTLYWQLNDCWPSVSWSSIDFFGNWKALHYKTKKVFDNVLVSSTIKDNTLKTYIINDDKNAIKGDLTLKLLDFYGKELWSMTKDIEVLENSSRIFNEVSLEKIDVSGTVLVSVFNNKSTTQYLTKPKELKLRKGEIIRKITKISSGYSITLTSQNLQKDLFLHTTSKGHFSDNFFDLLANETIEIEFETDHETLDDLSIKTLNQFIDFKD